MLNTNPRMRANQEQFSFYFDRVVKAAIIVYIYMHVGEEEEQSPKSSTSVRLSLVCFAKDNLKS